MSKWITRWRDEIAAKPTMPGVWRRKAGGFRIRGRAKDPRTGKLREVNKALPTCRRAKEAYELLQHELEQIRTVTHANDHRVPQFHSWAATVFERKVTRGKIASAKSREKWESQLRLHLVPACGEMYVDQIRSADVEAWKDQLAKCIGKGRGKYGPRTLNGWLSTLRVIMSAAVAEFELPRDPMVSVEPFDVTGYDTYTEEQPNSLRPEDVPRFLEAMRQSYPQHYAIVFLGFTTGLRPSSLRPLRRSGPHADIKWSDGLLLVRRSHTRHSEVMETTKTKRKERLRLPDELVTVLRQHADRLTGKQAESELLFPGVTGGLRAASSLDKPFREVGKAIELPYRVTPRAMRRTFQDLARSAGLHDLVTRSISGHQTESMQHLYSTVDHDEVRDGIARVIDLASHRRGVDQRRGVARGVERKTGTQVA